VRIRVIREPSRDGATLGVLFVDNVFQCFTLEDEIREQKVPGLTAIPAGTYPVVLTMSARFKKVLPELKNVRNYSGVRIHSGNTAKDTEGCLLVGQTRGSALIAQSRAALEALQAKIRAAVDRHEDVAITLENPLD
jgi:hypothetical protein